MKYPRIGKTEVKSGNAQAKCKCGEVAKFRVHVQIDYMRGNDEVLWACPGHRKNATYLIEGGE